MAHLDRIYAGEVPAPEVHHSYHITIATALLIGSADESQAAEFYHVSNETMTLALQNEDLAAVRALLSVAVYTMFATTGPSVWHILGTTLRLATSLGLHKARPTGNVIEEEMAKRAFWSLYNLDRLIASTLGRPLGIADEDISIGLPREFNDNWTETPGASAMTIPLQVVRLRRIFSRIYRYCKSLRVCPRCSLRSSPTDCDSIQQPTATSSNRGCHHAQSFPPGTRRLATGSTGVCARASVLD